jgi:hypothetical protein
MVSRKKHLNALGSGFNRLPQERPVSGCDFMHLTPGHKLVVVIVLLSTAKTRPVPNYGERPFETCIAVIQ